MADAKRPIGNAGNTTFVSVLIVVAVLYFARTVFIPLSLAILLAFLQAPLVIRLRHWGLGRVCSTLIVVTFSFAVIGIVGTLMASQLADLGHKLPGYQENVHEKLESLRSSGGGVVNRVSRFARSVSDELTPPSPGPNQARPDGEKPVPVEIHRSAFSPLDALQKILGSLLSALVTSLIVIVFVIFMLIEREDLRDRMIRLGGAGRVNLTTKVLDDAAQRVSRYLLAQLVVNVGYGFLVGVALYVFEVPNPLLWGIVAALLRYIPYVGIWVAAFMPAAIAFAVEPGWVKVPVIFGLYLGIDLLMYNVVEPYLYGTSTGVSPLAILVAAVFWTWLWGPVGLLLATPLTVCVVVIGRHVPKLGFLEVLLSDQPVLTPETRFYQRMLSMDLEEATEIAESFLKDKTLEDLYDQLIVPALTLAERDRHDGKLDDSRQRFVFENTRALVEDVGERVDELVAAHGSASEGAQPVVSQSESGASSAQGLTVLCIPARDEADEIASVMLAQLLKKRGVAARVSASGALAGESVNEIERDAPRVACICSIPPFGYTHTRYLSRRLRSSVKQLNLIAAILTEKGVEDLKQRQPPLAVDEIGSSLRQALAQVLSLISVQPEGAVRAAA